MFLSQKKLSISPRISRTFVNQFLSRLTACQIKYGLKNSLHEVNGNSFIHKTKQKTCTFPPFNELRVISNTLVTTILTSSIISALNHFLLSSSIYPKIVQAPKPLSKSTEAQSWQKSHFETGLGHPSIYVLP